MKNLKLTLLALGATVASATAQNFGIGTNAPTNKLHVKPSATAQDPVRFENLKGGNAGDSVLVVTQGATNGASGAGVVRMLTPKDFIQKNDLFWPYHTDDRIFGTDGNAKGIIARPGSGQVASGNYSHAEGVNTKALGNYNWSIMEGNTVNGDHNFVMGTSNNIPTTAPRYYPNSNNNLVVGSNNSVTSAFSFVVGNSNSMTNGYTSLVAGELNRSAADYSFIFGQNNESFGGANALNFAAGIANKMRDAGTYALGKGNDIYSNTSQSVAIGEDNELGFGGGTYNYAMGNQNKVVAGVGGVAIGALNTVSSIGSVGEYSMAIGARNDARGLGSIAIGSDNLVYNTTPNGNSVALGNNNTSNGPRDNFSFGASNYTGATRFGMSLGFSNNVGHEYAITLGRSASTVKDNSLTARFSNGYIFYTNASPDVTTGVELTAGATAWTSLSDATTKTNIRENTYGLNEVMKLGTYSYNYINNPSSQRNIGVIAQEVKALMPELAPVMSSGKIGVNYTELIPVLIKAIQELKEEVDALKGK